MISLLIISIICNIHYILGGVYMSNLKNKLSKGYVKWRYSNEETPQLVKIGMKIGFGIMCIITALIFLLKF